MGRMGRREFLVLSGAALTGIGGCLDGELGATLETPTPGPTATETATPEPTAERYGPGSAALDGSRYALQNLWTLLALSGNGLFPMTPREREDFESRTQGMVTRSGVRREPVANPSYVSAPFADGDPRFTEDPVFDGPNGRPDGETLRWDRDRSSRTVTPRALAWTHLAGVAWAKNFEVHADSLPRSVAPRFRAQMGATLAQHGVRFALLGDAVLRSDEEGDGLVSGYRRGESDPVVDEERRPLHHTATLWLLSELVSLARGGWFGYAGPRPPLSVRRLESLMNEMAETTMDLFPVDELRSVSTRDVGEMLAAFGSFGNRSRDARTRSRGVRYTEELAALVEGETESDGWVGQGALNQAATQGAVAQGLVWASRVDGVDRVDLAEDVVGYLLEELWDPDAATFASGEGETAYSVSARDAADVVAGLSIGMNVLGRRDAEQKFADFVDGALNRGRLQRADLRELEGGGSRFAPPRPRGAGGPFGQAPVFNAEVEYDAERERWSVTDDRFDAAPAMALATQLTWAGRIGGRPFPGFGLPGRSEVRP